MSSVLNLEIVSRPFTVQQEVTIRPGERDDLPGLEWCGLFSHDAGMIRREFTQQQQGTALVLLAVVQGLPAGQVWIDFQRDNRECVVLWAVRVVTWLKRLGIGVRLLQAAEAVARRRRVRCVELTVEKTNPMTLRLYRRLGYHVIGESDADGRTEGIEPLDCLWLQKPVAAPAARVVA